MEDLALLKQYADSGSEAAFRELVERHLATVYSAARRQVGEALAGDVTQAVFVLLARKAATLRSNTILTAWLLTTTRLVSHSTRRKEFRRHHYEQEAAHMPAQHETTEVQSAWDQVQPILDEALAALSNKDRGLVALRFFERKSHAEIAAALGVSEETSKKRLSRAVERMRAFFSKRGVVLGAALLLTVLSQNAVQAAPAGLVSQISTAATSASLSASVAMLVKTTLNIMSWIKLKIAAVSTAAVLAVVSVPVIVTLAASDSTFVQSDGRAAKLERYDFKAGTIRYRYPASAPRPTDVVWSSDFPGEKILTAEFSWEVGPTHPEASSLRLVTADELGNEFDAVVNNVNGIESSGSRQHWADGPSVFPRRGNEVRLRLLDSGKLLAEFKIPNPAPGPHAEWTATPLPSHATNDTLVVTLSEFRAHQTRSRTECAFAFQEHNRETIGWRPIAFEIADATGNHWKPTRHSGENPFDAKVAGNLVRAEFLGALWPGESAWKVRTEFQRVADFPENELLRISNIRIPDATEIAEPKTRYEWNGAVVEVAAVMGTNISFMERSISMAGATTREERMRRARLVNTEPRRGCVNVVFDGQILSRNRRMTFVSATDERGHPIELVSGTIPEAVESKADLPYSYVLRVPDGAREINLVVGISESKVAEFLARPEQMR